MSVVKSRVNLQRQNELVSRYYRAQWGGRLGKRSDVISVHYNGGTWFRYGARS